MKIFIGVLVVVALISPVFAAEEFYVVQDVKTMKCFVIDKPPANANVKLMGTNDKSYQTRAAAETAMQTVKGCAVP